MSPLGSPSVDDDIIGVAMSCPRGKWALQVPLSVDLDMLQAELRLHRSECPDLALGALLAGAF
jgi:hypothetical protein